MAKTGSLKNTVLKVFSAMELVNLSVVDVDSLLTFVYISKPSLQIPKFLEFLYIFVAVDLS